MFDSKLCKQCAALQRRLGFRRWPIVASLVGGERSRDSTLSRQLPYTNKSKRDICISTPSYGVRAANSPREPCSSSAREYAEPKRGSGGWGVEWPLSLLFQPLPAFFHRIVQPPKSIYPSAIVSLIYSQANYLFLSFSSTLQIFVPFLAPIEYLVNATSWRFDSS